MSSSREAVGGVTEVLLGLIASLRDVATEPVRSRERQGRGWLRICGLL